jgi:hypothetical protein
MERLSGWNGVTPVDTLVSMEAAVVLDAVV